MNNGYREVSLSEHRLASKNGSVYEHRIVAEKVLGRPLLYGETVHHIDGCRDNNDDSNIMVFKSSSDHARFHKTGISIRTENGAYVGGKKNILVNICLVCGSPCVDKYCSHRCSSFKQRKTIHPSKEDLVAMIETRSFEDIGRQYGVTGAAVKKWVRRYGIEYKPYHLNGKV